MSSLRTDTVNSRQQQLLPFTRKKKKKRKAGDSRSKNLFVCVFFGFLFCNVGSFQGVPCSSASLTPTEPRNHILRDYALIHSTWPARSTPSFHGDLLKRQRSKVLSRNRNTAVLLSEISKTDLKLTTSKLDSI